MIQETNRVEGWELRNGALERAFVFADFQEALAFMVRTGIEAEKAGHHPEIWNSYRKVTLRLQTHDRGGAVTDKDYALAAAINRIAG